MKEIIAIIISLSLVLIVACVPPDPIDEQEIIIDLSDEETQAIFELQDQRHADSLITLLSSKSTSQRYIAAQGLASMKSSKSIDKLSSLLIEDPSPRVRQAAAYALGQIGDTAAESVLIASFAKQDTADFNTSLRATILEAVGKCGSVGTLALIADTQSYTAQDDQLLLGQARSIYRFAQRGVTDKLASLLMIKRVLDKKIPLTTRRMAGQYLSRFTPDISEYQDQLALLLSSEQDAQIRMSIATALGKSGDPEVLPKLLSSLSGDEDYRVKCNILRQLDNYEYYSYRDSVLNLTESSNEHVALTAIQVLTATAHRRDGVELLNRANAITQPRRKAALLGAAINSVPSNYVNTRGIINKAIIEGLGATNGAYDKISYLNALALDPVNYEVFKASGLNANEAPIQSAAIAAIPSLLSNIRTLRIYRRPGALDAFKKRVLADMMEVVGQGDAGALAGIATVVRDESLGLKPLIDTILPFSQALSNLEMPGDIETINELRSTIAYLQGAESTNLEMDFNHPIDWSQLDNLSDSSHAVIITTRGKIELKLYTSSAPATIANFVKLANDNFYDGKAIHRVVPNFVIQGGCPRGDGYGSLGYTIRSDVSQHYYDEAGYIGMASAGPDTEGTQWFITNSATPHLDGRYSIFGKVTSGMEVVHDIQVGDIIQDVRILKFR